MRNPQRSRDDMPEGQSLVVLKTHVQTISPRVDYCMRSQHCYCGRRNCQ